MPTSSHGLKLPPVAVTASSLFATVLSSATRLGCARRSRTISMQLSWALGLKRGSEKNVPIAPRFSHQSGQDLVFSTEDDDASLGISRAEACTAFTERRSVLDFFSLTTKKTSCSCFGRHSFGWHSQSSRRMVHCRLSWKRQWSQTCTCGDLSIAILHWYRCFCKYVEELNGFSNIDCQHRVMHLGDCSSFPGERFCFCFSPCLPPMALLSN